MESPGHAGSACRRNPIALQQSHDAMQRFGKFLGVGHVAAIQVMAEAESVVSIQNVTQSHLTQVMTSQLVMSPLRQAVAFVLAM